MPRFGSSATQTAVTNTAMCGVGPTSVGTSTNRLPCQIVSLDMSKERRKVEKKAMNSGDEINQQAKAAELPTK